MRENEQNLAQEMIDEIKRAMQSREFSSDAELQAFVQEINERRNRRPIGDFDGLSSQQMHRLLHFPFDSPDLLEFAPTTGAEPTGPIVTLFRLLVEAVGEDGLKPTATGNLPRKFLREAHETYVSKETYPKPYLDHSVNSENDFGDMNLTRLVAQAAKLVRKYKGKFVLSRDCRELLSRVGMPGIYPRVLRTFTQTYNWGYADCYQDFWIIQHSFAFTLLLLHRHGEQWRPSEFYEDAFVKAFPAVVDEVVPDAYITPEQKVRSCYSCRCLERFACFLGLADIESDPDDLFRMKFRIRKTSLLDDAVRFHL